MQKENEMRLIDCSGPPRERGRAHGRALRDEITQTLSRWANATIKSGASEVEIDAYCETFVGGTGHIERAKTQTPGLYEELRGIAEGAGQPFNRLAAFNLMDEQWWHDASFGKAPPGCSLIASRIRGGNLLSQNMDLPEHLDGSQVVLRLSGPDIPDTILLSAAGLIGLTGANSAGVAVGVNTLLMLHHDGEGLPVAFALRKALSALTAQEAAQALRETAHASGQHYAIVTREDVLSFECSRGGCSPVTLPEKDTFLHTNHPLSSKDIDPETQAVFEKAGFNAGSRIRLDWMQSRSDTLKDASAVLTALDDPETPLCMQAHTHDGSCTFASVIYEMTTSPVIRMRRGIAGSGPWITIPFPQIAAASAG